MFGAVWLAAEAGITSIAWPTGASAEREEETEEHRGLYFIDEQRWLRGVRRIYPPNFFATFGRALGEDPTRSYYVICLARATALHHLGDTASAE